jgi:hypothetical protein|tara:strand:+ start:710 stop:1201 length:492 start_codon:yes stop_codon:yes gene_type:complete
MASKASPKADKVWAYLVKNKTATPVQVSKATGVSYGYAYKIMQKIGTPKEVFVAEEEAKSTGKKLRPSGENSEGFSRGQILDTAKLYVTKDRAADHGDMKNNFSRTAGYWATYLAHPVSATDVAVMMTLLKIARINFNPKHPDNWVDGAGYMACGGELAGGDS